MHKNIELYFLHGWGFNQSIWNDWLSVLDKSIPAYVFDRGYFQNKQQGFNFNFSGRSKIVIAHSLGIHYLAPKDFSQIHTLVLISGFRSFHECATNARSSEKQIDLMKQRLMNDASGLLKDFYTNCGISNSTGASPIVNRELLYDDLVFLNKHQLDLDNLKPIPQILLLHGASDVIVNVEHSKRLHESLPHSRLFVRDDSGHALPLTDTDWCVKIVQSRWNKKPFANPMSSASEC